MFHDDEAGIGLGIARGEDKVVAHGGTTARLLEEELADVVLLFPKVHHLVEHGLAGDVKDAADDDVADFASAVAADDVEGAVVRHSVGVLE